MQVLVTQCQLWVARLTASLSTVTVREIHSLEEQVLKKQEALCASRRQQLTDDTASSASIDLDAEKAVLQEFNARLASLQENAAALPNHKVLLCNNAACTCYSRHADTSSARFHSVHGTGICADLARASKIRQPFKNC